MVQSLSAIMISKSNFYYIVYDMIKELYINFKIYIFFDNIIKFNNK